MKSKLAGFTLIELIVVIVIIGILMAVAMPKLQNIDSDAKKAVVQGALASVAGASQMMYGHFKSPSTLSDILSSVSISDPLVSITANGLSVGKCFTTGGTTNSLVSAYYNSSAGGMIAATIESIGLDATLCSG